MFKNKLTFINVIIGLCVVGLVITFFLFVQFSLKNNKARVADNRATEKTREVSVADQAKKENNLDYQEISDENIQPEKMSEKLAFSSDDNVWGEKDSPVKIVIYDDFQCPFCVRFYDTIEQIKKEFSGKIAIALRHNPLYTHANAFPAAMAAECAAEQGKFWEMYSKLFEDSKSGKLSTEESKNNAKELKLDQEKFNSCLDNNKYKEKIAQQMVTGKEIGANGTPTFFVNGKIYPGAYPLDDFVDSTGNKVKGIRNIILSELEINK